jgi:hypothetical protein
VDVTLAAELDEVHRDVRDDEHGYRGLDVDEEREERGGDGGEADADSALDEGGDEDDEGG